jgi:hypothetical protein
MGMPGNSMSTNTDSSFKVSDVNPATSPLPEIPFKQAVEALLKPAPMDWDEDFDEEDFEDDEEIGFEDHAYRPPAPDPDLPVEACSRYHGRLVAGVAFHPVAAAVHLAFTGHRPLRLSPDAIWLLICQAVANHINAHADELRPRLVRHQGRARIEVRRDDFLKGSPENPWPEVFSEFSAKVKDHIGPEVDRFLPAFSTTGPVERAAAEIVLLDAVRSYFECDLATLCGIPTITLEGTPDDWRVLAERLGSFADLGMGRWLEALGPILGQFVRASQGDVDQKFWRSLYKLNDQSGGPVLTGWMMAFFPYLKNHRTGAADTPDEIYLKGSWDQIEQKLYPPEESCRGWVEGPSIESLPGGLSKAPFRWEYLDRVFDMEFLGGFVGVAQDERTLALRPEIGWAIREATGPC